MILRINHHQQKNQIPIVPPREYKADNKFHKIEVRIRGGGYRITHRAGYVAD